MVNSTLGTLIERNHNIKGNQYHPYFLLCHSSVFYLEQQHSQILDKCHLIASITWNFDETIDSMEYYIKENVSHTSWSNAHAVGSRLLEWTLAHFLVSESRKSYIKQQR